MIKIVIQPYDWLWPMVYFLKCLYCEFCVTRARLQSIITAVTSSVPHNPSWGWEASPCSLRVGTRVSARGGATGSHSRTTGGRHSDCPRQSGTHGTLLPAYKGFHPKQRLDTG